MKQEIIDMLTEDLLPTVKDRAIEIFNNLETKAGKNRSLLRVALPLTRRLLQSNSSALTVPDVEDKIIEFTKESWPLFENAKSVDEEANLMVVLRDGFIARYSVDVEVKTTIH